jgi:long-chain acyl-CoA synthetase
MRSSLLPQGETWWQGCGLERFVTDLLVAELSRLRPGTCVPPPPWPMDLEFAEGVLGIDSLERLNFANAVGAALDFAPSGQPDRLMKLPTLGDWLDEARRLSKGGHRAIGFSTSGSSGAARFVRQSLPALEAETEILAKIFAGRQRIVSVVPCHHIYGFLTTLMLPLRLNCVVLDARRQSPVSLRSLIKPGDLIVAFPTFWRSALEAGLTWPEDIEGVSSGAPLLAEVHNALRGAQLARLTEIYGSTETGGIGWRADPHLPFRLLPYWAKQDDDHIAKAIDGSMVSFLLPDHVSWHAADLLTPQRRWDGAVQVGGVNVSLERVRAILMGHPGVAGAEVRLMRPDEGDRLKAFVVPRDAAEDLRPLRSHVEAWLRDRLSTAELPRAYTFGPELPTSATGKPSDWSIALACD